LRSTWAKKFIDAISTNKKAGYGGMSLSSQLTGEAQINRKIVVQAGPGHKRRPCL
jgi:hypothetical protein